MSLNSLPIRSAGNARRPSQHTTPQPSSSHVDLAVSPEPNLSLVGDAGDDSHASPSIEADPEHDPEQEHDPEDGAVVAPLYPEHFRLDTAAAAAATAVASSGSSSNHQFWLKDAKIAEDLFTIHRSAKHLAEFVCTCRREIAPTKMSSRQLVLAATIIGNHDPALGHRPIPVMSDGDVLFMTQLSNDIARSVGGISAVRHHGLRTKKRKTRTNGVGAHSSRKDDRIGMNGGKRIQLQKAEEATVACSKCGRTETPEWRKGPDGLLCNVCGLVYAKQRRKLKSG